MCWLAFLIACICYDNCISNYNTTSINGYINNAMIKVPMYVSIHMCISMTNWEHYFMISCINTWTLCKQTLKCAFSFCKGIYHLKHRSWTFQSEWLKYILNRICVKLYVLFLFCRYIKSVEILLNHRWVRAISQNIHSILIVYM